MSIRRTGFPVLILGVAAMLAASPVLAQNINIDVGTLSLSPSAAYGAGAGQPGNWTTVIANITTPQPLNDINGVPTTATLTFLAANGDFNFDNVGTTGDDQALMDDGGDMGGTGATDTILIEHLSAGTYTVYTYAWAPDNATYITSVNVNGQGLQNVGGPWPGAQTAGITYSTHSNIVVPADGTITIITATVTTFSTLNGFQLVGGANDLGRCCDLGGSCAITSEEDCVAPSIFAGLGTNCAGDPCRGRCCDNEGLCELTGPGDCSAPSVFGGLGTNCSGSPCMGRCCSAGGNCSVAPVITCAGTATPGLLNCDSVQVFQFNDVNMFMQDNPVQTPSSNVQTIESPNPLIITDLDVDLNATHAWPGDVLFRLEHLGTSVVIYDRPGVPEPAAGFGCATDNFNIVLDDEGSGGPIEGICNLAPPSALSPPNYTPNNPLAAFDGMDAVGEWTITSIDFFNGDNGTLLSWSLHISTDGAVCPIVGCTCFGDVNGDAAVNGRDITPFAACVASGGAGCPCGDMNHAGGATSADVTAFVNAVITSTCGAP